MNARTFFTELKRRRVYSVAVAYVVVAWLLIQVATQVFPFFDIPKWVVRLVVLLAIVGFPIAVVCAWAFEMTPAGIKLEGDADRRIIRKTGRKLTALIVILAALAAGVTVFRFFHSQQATEGGKQPPLTVAIESNSIAVLPFANLSEEEANAYFASGMRDEILTSLAQLRDLNVRSRTSTQKYQSHPEDLGALSRELGVASVLEGSVQKAGDDVLINVQLIDTRNGQHLWAQSYRHNVQHIFSVQGEVAQKVADALKIKLGPAQEQRLLVPPTTNARAHDLFLRAHALGAHSDEQSLEGKIALLQEAVAEDPHYAMAWGDLAGAYLTIADAYRAPREVLSPMRHAALMSVKSDEGAGVGHIWLGAVFMLYDRNFPLAKRELERAVALNPNSPDAHRWLGWYLARVERGFVAGRKELQRARLLDPQYTWPIMFESYIEIARGEYESALQLAEQVMEIDPRFFYDVDPIANVYAAQGRWHDAVERYESLPPELLARPNFQLAICYVHVGKSDRARQMLADLDALSQQRYVDQMHIAAIHAALGEKDKAFAALDRACEDRSARVSTPRFYQWLAPLFTDARFAALEYKVAHSAISSPLDAGP
jgi:TolB-like protein